MKSTSGCLAVITASTRTRSLLAMVDSAQRADDSGAAPDRREDLTAARLGQTDDYRRGAVRVEDTNWPTTRGDINRWLMACRRMEERKSKWGFSTIKFGTRFLNLEILGLSKSIAKEKFFLNSYMTNP